ncbi:MAG: molybdopterin-synthase adenylyltransferase MoeB [Cytophagales bacterium]|nr:molybdopterin-synthase adenylyltransferase MoeB [Cytophagales bacterium]
MNTERYQRQIVLPDFGAEGQRKLDTSKVLIVGSGGLGVPVMQYLVGMGVGTITVMDADEVSLSNLHRQVVYTTNDIGRKKVEVAKERLGLLNPEISIIAISEMLTSENAESTIGECNIVVDCTDNIESRYILNDTCVMLDKPFVYGALYRHEGHVSVFNHQGSVSYRDVYPDDSVNVQNCNEVGVLGVLPGIIGCYQAMEVVKILTDFGDPLVGKLMVVNAMTSEHHTFFLGSKKEKVEPTNHVENKKFQTMSWEKLENTDLTKSHLIDVRSAQVFDESHDSRFENIPLQMIAGFEPNPNYEVVLVCDRGIATKQAAAILSSSFPDIQVYQIEGGYQVLAQ